ncbi:hypothetical protein [Subtercola boreus]|uniref:hypothetical protein n=1 Tax=Subtercola boreus TaxID=120213 RepID=UPI0011C07491|nr:hypothetical protein [Subtercola boreus]
MLFFDIGALLIALGVLAFCARTFLKSTRVRTRLTVAGASMILLGAVGLWALIPWPLDNGPNWTLEILFPLVWTVSIAFFVTGLRKTGDSGEQPI